MSMHLGIDMSMFKRSINALARRRRRDRIIANLTWKCNLGCPYCWVALSLKKEGIAPGQDAAWLQWSRAFQKMPPSVIDFAGGEPLLFPMVHALIASLPQRHKWAITTNLTLKAPLERLIASADPKRCQAFNCSYQRCSGMSQPEFLSHLQLVRSAGFPASVSVVVSDWTRATALADYEFFALHGFPVNLILFEDPRAITEGQHRFRCLAGSRGYTVNNNGDAYRCPTWLRYPGRKGGYLGNIFDGTFRKSPGVECTLSCEKCLRLDMTNSMRQDFALEEVPL